MAGLMKRLRKEWATEMMCNGVLMDGFVVLL